MKLRCAVYIRVSTVQQEEKGFSLDWQRKNLLEIAKTKDWSVAKNDIYDEGSQSGETIIERPQFQKLLENIKKQKYDIVLVSELERLSRAQYSKDWGIIGDTFCAHHVKVATPYQIFDINEVEDDFMFSLFGLLSKREKQKLLLRCQRGREEAKLKGRFLGGFFPLGYKYDRETRTLKKDSAFSDLPQLIFDLRGNKELSYRRIARHLRKNFPVTVRNGNWTEKTVARILRNPTYIGKRWVSIQGTPKLVPFVSEPLIDEKLFWKVQEFEEKRRIHPVPYRKYPAALLSGGGLSVCGYCGRSMVTENKTRRGSSERYYRCNARWSGYECNKSKRIRAERIEPVILKLINHIINLPDVVKSIYQNLHNALNADLDEANQRLKDQDRKLKDLAIRKKNLISQVEEGNLKGAIVADRLHEIETLEKACLSEKETLLKTLKVHSKRFISFEEYSDLHRRFLESFFDLSDEEKRKIVEFHIKKVEWFNKDFRVTLPEHLRFAECEGNILSFKYLVFKRGELKRLVKMGDGVTGNTLGSGPGNQGSIPCPPATQKISMLRGKVQNQFALNALSNGSTPGSGPGNLGSNPSPPATVLNEIELTREYLWNFDSLIKHWNSLAEKLSKLGRKMNLDKHSLTQGYPLNFQDILESEKHLFVELRKRSFFMMYLITHLFYEKKEKYGNYRNGYPAVYLLFPEEFEDQYPLEQYLKNLKLEAKLRIFSSRFSLLYSEKDRWNTLMLPSLPETERKRPEYKLFMREINKERGRLQERSDFKALFNEENMESSAQLIKELEMPTCAGFFSKYGLGHYFDCRFFYTPETEPKKMEYEPYQKKFKPEDMPHLRQRIGRVKLDLPKHDPSVLEIIQDLKPKNRDSSKEVC